MGPGPVGDSDPPVAAQQGAQGVSPTSWSTTQFPVRRGLHMSFVLRMQVIRGHVCTRRYVA